LKDSPFLTGKVAIVTGAARGLGLLVAEELAGRRMRVIGVDLRGEELSDGLARIAERCQADTIPIRADTSDEDQVVAMIDKALHVFGRIDVLVNNAGVRHAAPVWATETAAWDRVHNSNLKAQFLCTREALRRDMLQRGEGALVFVSSMAGKRGTEGASAYSASKWAVLGFAASVAKDLKNTRIRVTAVTPGRLDTPMARESEVWALGLEWLDPKHVATAIAFCVEQDPDTIHPELHIHHRAQL